VTEGTHYGPGLHAHVVVQKCADSIPLYRQEKILKRAGVPLNRSTLKDLFHQCAELLKPIYDRMKNHVACSEYVNADETAINSRRHQLEGKART
ncbi:MAG: IS66 family transposase, partial [Deltaproteobacteria bacterium]|nr:IS66 family transposase [Deltaproteobacteria bacterium]